MLTYTSSGVPNSGIPQMLITGDGESTILNVDLTLPPFEYNYKGNKPISISNVNFSTGSGLVELNPDRHSVVITFDTAPTVKVSVNFQLQFAGQ